MKNKKISRRDFLKVAGVILGGSVATCYGVNLLAGRAIQEETGKLLTPAVTYGEGNSLEKRVLIVYATYAGSTMEVAKAIGEELGRLGHLVDVKPVNENPEITGYQAVILGSAVHYGEWLPEAVDYVKANQTTLANVPVALFTVHITNLGEDAASREARLAYLNQIRPFVKPESEAFFAGVFDRRGAALLLPKAIAWMMPVMDQRDWKKIRGWAQRVIT